MKKVIVYILVILICASTFIACGQSDQMPKEEQIKMICELSTLKCFYNNVAKSTIPGSWIKKERKIWMEYEGYAEIGIDMNEVSIELKGNEVTVVLPKAKVVHCGIVTETLNEGSYILSEDGWWPVSNKITTEEQNEMMVKAQAEMKEISESNTMLLNQAEQRAKVLIENYINQLGEAAGVIYEIKWRTAESAAVNLETTAA